MDPILKFCFFRISKTENIALSARKYRDLRLKALLASPASFSSTYEIESAFTDAEWIKLLTADGRETFICATICPQDDTQQGSHHAEWVGQVTIRGPLTHELSLQNCTLEEANASGTINGYERWQMLSLFTFSQFRGQGLGKRLCQETFGFIKAYRSQPDTAQVCLIVKSDNLTAIKLYERLGFHHAGRCTLVDALIANGEDLIPADISGPKYTDLTGSIMKYSIIRSKRFV
ncbi:hypothetical protein N7462_005580 [Penicillium macrosclerotiorum]|uniref:uncharacterized protein n=1 Tax=Penicillium macrosclerotiorum TaxID=303699 RepID=UPI0025484127|nr:uncharacterized protein N7462_005580 [Penicillium macrosclerotiorum]KAJ5682415.1 hypothetical protein N7462_005580 [Penicillium macrosclerotiorum]